MLKRLPPVLLFDKLWNECGMLASWSPRRLEKLVRVSLYMRMEQRTKFIQNSLIFARFYWLLHVTWCTINRPRTTSIFIIRLFPSERKKIEKKAWRFFRIRKEEREKIWINDSPKIKLSTWYSSHHSGVPEACYFFLLPWIKTQRWEGTRKTLNFLHAGVKLICTLFRACNLREYLWWAVYTKRWLHNF